MRRTFPSNNVLATANVAREASRRQGTSMNNIQEKDWADDSWFPHTGVDTFEENVNQQQQRDKTDQDTPAVSTPPSSQGSKE